MGHFGMIPVRPFHPMVKWDGMDIGCTNGTLWYDPSPSIPSHGEVGWNGQWGQDVANGTLWYDPSPSIPSHSTVGWDRQWGLGTTNGTLWYDPSPSIPSHSTVGWDGQLGQGVANGTLWYDPSPSIPSHGTVGWDGQWGQGVANGTLWYDPSPSIPSHGEVGWDGQWEHKWDTLVQSQTIQNSTVWDSQCIIGRLLAILDMCAIFTWISPSFSSLAIVVNGYLIKVQ